MLKYGKDIETTRDREMQNYNSLRCLSPVHYTVDIGTSKAMQAIIVAMVSQYINFDKIGFPKVNKTALNYTLKYYTEDEFINILWTTKERKGQQYLSQKDKTLKIKKLISELDKEWVKKHIAKKNKKNKNKKAKKTKSADTLSPNIDKTSSSLSPNTQISAVTKSSSTQSIEKELANIGISTQSNTQNMDIDEEDEANGSDIEDADELEMNILDELDLIGDPTQNEDIIIPQKLTKSNENIPISLDNEHREELEKLREINDDYQFEHLLCNKFNDLIEDKKDEEENLFAPQTEHDEPMIFDVFDQFSADNWTQIKWIGQSGEVQRGFLERRSMNKIRELTTKVMIQHGIQIAMWKYDNKDKLEKIKKIKKKITNGEPIDLVITSHEEKIRKLRKQIVKNKYIPPKDKNGKVIDIQMLLQNNDIKDDDDDDDNDDNDDEEEEQDSEQTEDEPENKGNDDEQEEESDGNIDQEMNDKEQESEKNKNKNSNNRNKRKSKSKRKTKSKKSKRKKIEIELDNTYAHQICTDRGIFFFFIFCMPNIYI